MDIVTTRPKRPTGRFGENSNDNARTKTISKTMHNNSSMTHVAPSPQALPAAFAICRQSATRQSQHRIEMSGLGPSSALCEKPL